MQARVGRPHGRVLAQHEHAVHVAVEHPEHGRVDRVVAGQPRQVVEAVLVAGVGVLAPPRLEQAGRVRLHVAPEAAGRGVQLEEPLEAVVRVRVRHRDVAGEDVVERRDVGRPLDRRVAAQREDAAAGAADVAQQQLDDRGGADDLHADGVLRPADRVADRRRALAAGVAAQRLGDATGTRRAVHAAHVGDELGRVPAVVALEQLEDAARMLQRRILLGRLRRGAGARRGRRAPARR